jgi:hypothetical protein
MHCDLLGVKIKIESPSQKSLTIGKIDTAHRVTIMPHLRHVLMRIISIDPDIIAHLPDLKPCFMI